LSKKRRSRGSIETFPINIEEKSFVALKISARTPLFTIFPFVPNNLARLINLSGTPGSTIVGSSCGAFVVGTTLEFKWEDALFPKSSFALALPEAPESPSTSPLGPEGSPTLLSIILGTGQTAPTCIQSVLARCAAHRGLANAN